MKGEDQIQAATFSSTTGRGTSLLAAGNLTEGIEAMLSDVVGAEKQRQRERRSAPEK